MLLLFTGRLLRNSLGSLARVNALLEMQDHLFQALEKYVAFHLNWLNAGISHLF